MAGLLDFLMQGQGGGLLGLGGPQNLPDAFGGNQGMMLAGLGLASGASPGEGFKNMMPALQQAYEQQQNQRAAAAAMGMLPPSGGQPGMTPRPPGGPAMALNGTGQPLLGADGGIMPPGSQGAPQSSYSKAIAANESGGNYNALGQIIPKTGDRAYGKYQVMGANVPQWTQEVLGQQMTPQQFVASPDAQEAVFKAKFGQYAQKYGPEGAARAWFAGEGGMNNPNATDPLGTTVASYGQKFMQNGGGAALPPNSAPTQGFAVPGQQQPPQVPAPQSPQLGGNMPGSGLQLIDSPALQGMPDTVRRALPIMLQSKQYAPQAMQMIQKYLNPEQWQLYRDTMGNVFTRNNATGESKPLIQATPDMMNANASGFKSPFEQFTAQKGVETGFKNTELTGEQKNANASGNLTPLQFEERKANQTLTTEQKNAMTPEAIATYEATKKQAQEAALKRGEAEGIAQSGLTNALMQGELALKNIQQIREHPGKESLGGVGALGVLPGVPGTNQKGFVTLVDQLKGKTFLQAFESLKGGGAISNSEGSKAQGAIARLDRAQKPEDFNAALNDLEGVIKTGMANARSKAAGISAQPKAADTANIGGTTKSGIKWSVQ